MAILVTDPFINKLTSDCNERSTSNKINHGFL